MMSAVRNSGDRSIKGPISLRKIYLMVGVTGTIIMALILFGFYNGERLHDIKSPLLTACQEIRLEAAAARHGIGDILSGEVVHSPSNVWAYLDQSIWYLQNLLESNERPYSKWMVSSDSEVNQQIADLKISLEALKAFSAQNVGKTMSQGLRDATLKRYDQHFMDFTSRLVKVEDGITRLATRERFLYRFSHIGLIVLCVFILGFVALAFQRYDGYRSTIFAALNDANAQLKNHIEERKRVERALRESENLFRTVFDTSPDSIILSRLEDNAIVAVNRGFIELTGFSKEEVLGKTALDLSLWEDVAKRKRFLAILEASRFVRNFESRFRMKNGHMQTALLSVNSVDIGDVPHFITVARNISELKEVENALRESEGKFRGLFEHAVDFIHLLDAEGRIMLSNPAAIRGLGYSLSQLQNRPLTDFVDSAVKPYLEDMLPRLADQGHFRRECNLITGDGRTITVDCSATPVRNDAGEIDFIVVFQEDISNRKIAENKLQASYEFLTIANRHKEMQPLLTDFIAAVKRLSGCSAVVVQILDEDGSVPFTVTEGYDAEICSLGDSLAVRVDSDICRQVVRNETDAELPYFTERGSYFVRRNVSPDVHGGCDTGKCPNDGSPVSGGETLALIPIRLADQTIGLVHVAGGPEDKLTIEVVEVLESAAVQLGTAIQRVLAEEALSTAYRELEERVRERTRELTQTNEDLQNQIAERRRTEESLRKSHSMLQTVIDGIKDALILVDQDMHIRMLNKFATEYYGIESPAKAIGQLCYHASGHVGICNGCQIPKAVLRGEPVTFERKGLQNSDRLEAVSIYPVKEKDSPTGGAIVRIADITEEKRFERQLIQSEKMASLGILVSSIAHEINNPNNFVTFNIPILRDYLEELVAISDRHAENLPDFELFHMTYAEFREDIFKLVDNIEHGARRISSFVANLREFSQSDGNRQKVMLDLPVVVDKVLSICRSQIKKRVKTFEINLPSDLPPLCADEYSLEQILINLIVNAVQAADKKESFVRLTAASGSTWRDHTIIRVVDNGCGMDPKTAEKIFDPFFTTKSTEEGTGLGLYVCHNLVQSLGGRIEVESTPGEGTTFAVILPDKDRRQAPRP